MGSACFTDATPAARSFQPCTFLPRQRESQHSNLNSNSPTCPQLGFMAAYFLKFVGSAGIAGFVYWWIRSNK